MKKLMCLLLLAVSCLATFVGCKTSQFDVEDYAASLTLSPMTKLMVPTDMTCLRSAVVFGLTRVDSNKWSGWDGDCPGADVDRERVTQYIDKSGAYCKRVLFSDTNATRGAVLAGAVWAGTGLKSNDLIVIAGSCHGGEKINYDKFEAEKKDQYAALADGPFDDDLVWQCLCQATKDTPGLRFVMFLDMCNSRTMFRGAPHNYAESVRQRVMRARTAWTWNNVVGKSWERVVRGPEEEFNGSLLVIAGCDDGKSSYGSAKRGGELTYAAFAQVGPSGYTYAEWFLAIAAAMPANQVPYMSEVGPSFSHYEAMK